MAETTVSASQAMILDAAKSLIMQSGYSGFSMRQLAQESGFAKGTIYHYFRDKQDIYLKVIERELLGMRVHLQSAAQQGDDPREQLEKTVRAYFSHAEAKHHSTFLLLREVGDLQEELRRLIATHRHDLLRPFTDILERGIAAGLYRPVDADAAVTALLGMMNSTVTTRLFFEEASIDETLIRGVLDLFLHGVAASDSR